MKSKILNILRSSDTYVSGEEISKLLGISRAAIWKHINQLKKEGYQIDSLTKNGYKLISSPDILSFDEISPFLKTKFIGHDILYYESIDSTNTFAKSISQNCKDGLVIIAEEQTKGRGRLGRTWVSPKRKGIWMSIILHPNLPPSEAHKLTIITASSIYNTLCKFNVDIKIKWPNDILINGKKICGILTEMNAELNHINSLVIGIGINVNTEVEDFNEELTKIATSLRIETGKFIDRKKLTAEILNNFEDFYIDYLSTKDIRPYLEIVRKNSALINKYVEIIKPNEKYIAKVVDIDDDGQLVIDNDGKIEKLLSGEVSLHNMYNGK
ncbi:biotin--[acetyl-CoA-carboxylase] ligase [Caloramator proteoclasticus]|uniref:Bifunctional ligase/repressor BirA n=1 Tax=Caloramator proteoclasticus DSM 10124 TaxID=1121262 RepID=A0A1M4TKF9_9CLOT|nr:biotin--[acetyl-CoA-carboxylase] ligase [Caloramator proteoclasticus]SHE44918.1 BirA family transcriptional regulator, biotin operon repressor / biotin-[acetyl-CoA-carboxylase] ligase [Caloramator proteoclasticus DSM 10124]